MSGVNDDIDKVAHEKSAALCCAVIKAMASFDTKLQAYSYFVGYLGGVINEEKLHFTPNTNREIAHCLTLCKSYISENTRLPTLSEEKEDLVVLGNTEIDSLHDLGMQNYTQRSKYFLPQEVKPLTKKGVGGPTYWKSFKIDNLRLSKKVTNDTVQETSTSAPLPKHGESHPKKVTFIEKLSNDAGDRKRKDPRKALVAECFGNSENDSSSDVEFTHAPADKQDERNGDKGENSSSSAASSEASSSSSSDDESDQVNSPMKKKSKTQDEGINKPDEKTKKVDPVKKRLDLSLSKNSILGKPPKVAGKKYTVVETSESDIDVFESPKPTKTPRVNLKEKIQKKSDDTFSQPENSTTQLEVVTTESIVEEMGLHELLAEVTIDTTQHEQHVHTPTIYKEATPTCAVIKECSTPSKHTLVNQAEVACDVESTDVLPIEPLLARSDGDPVAVALNKFIIYQTAKNDANDKEKKKDAEEKKQNAETMKLHNEKMAQQLAEMTAAITAWTAQKPAPVQRAPAQRAPVQRAQVQRKRGQQCKKKQGSKSSETATKIGKASTSTHAAQQTPAPQPETSCGSQVSLKERKLPIASKDLTIVKSLNVETATHQEESGSEGEMQATQAYTNVEEGGDIVMDEVLITAAKDALITTAGETADESSVADFFANFQSA